MAANNEPSLLDKLDSLGTPLKSFDAFPKLPATYKSRSAGGGLVTLGIICLCILLVLNDLGEYVWGETTYRYVVDKNIGHDMALNVDITVAMPCHYLSVDLRDAVGDRLHLSDQIRRDGTTFDARQARNILRKYRDNSAQQIMRDAKRRNSRLGFFDWLRKRNPDPFQATFNHTPDGAACRVYGSLEAKRVQANLHITTLGHGYHSAEHTDHALMNLSHIITEFSFGPYFPEIVQPLDYTVESSPDAFTAFQYFLTVVPTEYRTPAGIVKTHQYSVTSHKSKIQHGRGTPGIFFKFDIEPLELIIEQKTTTLIQFLIRVVGVIGGVWVCATWAVKVGNKGLEATGLVKKDDDIDIAESTATAKRHSMLGAEVVRRRHQSIASISSLGGLGGSPLPSPALSGGMLSPALSGGMSSPALSGGMPSPSLHRQMASQQYQSPGLRQPGHAPSASFSGFPPPSPRSQLPFTPTHRPSASVRVSPGRPAPPPPPPPGGNAGPAPTFQKDD